MLVVVASLGALVPSRALAATLSWEGYDWNLTDGGMAGVAEGSSDNVSVDSNGWLHLRIVKNGNAWTASEMFTTQKLGFGTYQWQIEGPVDVFDKQVVLGLFPYGPAAGIGGDGTNEIDIEFARWGQANGPNADFTDYPASGKTVGETTFKFSLDGGTSSTARFTWTKDSIESSVLKGHIAVGSETGLIKKWRYAPQNPSTNIPQQALPLGMNLWCFDAPPSDGKNVEIVVRDFQFIKEGDPLPGGGSGGTGSAGAGSGGSGSGGRNSGGAGGGTAGGNNVGGMSAGGSSAGGVSSGGSGATTGGTDHGGNASGAAGAVGASGASSAGSASGGASSGGRSGMAGGSGIAGSSSGNGSTETGGASSAGGSGGAAAASGAGEPNKGGALGSAGAATFGGQATAMGGSSGGAGAKGSDISTDPGTCSFKPASARRSPWAVLPLLALLLGRRRRQRARSS